MRWPVSDPDPQDGQAEPDFSHFDLQGGGNNQAEREEAMHDILETDMLIAQSERSALVRINGPQLDHSSQPDCRRICSMTIENVGTYLKRPDGC